MVVRALRLGTDWMSAWVKPALVAWDRFWFLPRQSHGVSLMRLLAGGMALYSTLVWGLELDAFIGETGWNNAGVVRGLQAGGHSLSYWWYVPTAWNPVVHWLSCAIVLLFTLGLFTRVTAVLAWCVVLSYANRAMFANFGLDQVVCMLLMYLMLAPCGEHFSIDALLRQRRASGAGIRLSVMSTLATRLIQLHLCVVYLFAGLSKLQGETWWNGNAVWNAISNYEYQSFDLTFLARWPLLTEFITQLTVLWEISFIVLVWNRRLRPFVILLGVAMHMGIGAFLGMWTFGLAMTFCYLSFVPPELIQSIAARLFSSRSQTPQASLGYQSPLAVASPTPQAPTVILVSRSKRLGHVVLRYLERLGLRVYWVDGMLPARQLCGCTDAIVISLQLGKLEEVRDWIEQARLINPRTRFVVRTEQIPEQSWPGVAFVVGECRMRDLRLACEELLGHTLKEADPGREHNSSQLTANLKRPRLSAGVVVSGLLVAVLTGCSTGGQTSTSSIELEKVAALNDSGRFDEALSVLANTGLSHDLVARAEYLKGISHEGLAQYELAIEAYSKCIELDRNHSDALNNRAVVFGKQDKIQLAIEDLTRATEINPEDSVAWSNLGLAYHELERFDEAIKNFDEAERRSENAEIPFMRGNAHLAAGRNQAAVADYDRAIALNNRFAEAFLNRSIALMNTGATLEALEALTTAEKLDSDMAIRAIAANVRDLISRSDLRSIAEQRVQAWLNAGGWEISDSPNRPASFRATRLPVAGSSSPEREPKANEVPEPPDEFFGIVLLQSKSGAVLCSQEIADSMLAKAQLPTCIFVYDVDSLHQKPSGADDPNFGLVAAYYDWVPAREDMQPYQYSLRLPKEKSGGPSLDAKPK